jgi:squalene-associated FAD-dependent desaturase
MDVAVIGAGWAGLAAAVAATRAGHRVTVFEAARTPGGRARSLPGTLPDGRPVLLDNGQHILIGAYTATLQLMQDVGVDPAAVLLRLPLSLRFPDGQGLALPELPAPLDAAWGIASARGWGWADKGSLLRAALGWQRARFRCDPDVSVAQLCRALTPRVMAELIEPLCVAALNTPAERSSGQVFLRVVGDALFGPGHGRWGGSNLLLPQAGLGQLFPEAAVQWLAARGSSLVPAHRVEAIGRHGSGWQVDGQAFERVVMAAPPWEAARLVRGADIDAAQWLARTDALSHEAITTVYATGGPRLPLPMLALRSGPGAPAQFVFDRSQLGGPAGLLAFVASASQGDRETLQAQVMAQAAQLGWRALQPLQTVVEKRATFACTPDVQRPDVQVAGGLLACGDYVEGPYPATIEGAVRAALEASALLSAD